MPRFVVLFHDWPTPHYDLMLERDGVLKTWRLAEEPNVGHPIAAQQIDDHRLHYLNYEGPIDGNRGNVTRWDCGELGWVQYHDVQTILGLDGEKLSGFFLILQTEAGRQFSFLQSF